MTTHVCDLRPTTDAHTHRLFDHTIHHLARLRVLPPDDPAVRLHLIASMLQQGETTLTRTVTDTINHGHTYTDINILLGLG